MSYTYYQNLVLIPDGHSLTMVQLFAQIQQEFPQKLSAIFEITDGQKMVIRVGDWGYYVHWSEAPTNIQEAQEIARFLPDDDPDRRLVEDSSKRIEMYGDPDPNMDYFNAYVYVLQAFDKLPGLFRFDAGADKLEKTGT